MFDIPEIFTFFHSHTFSTVRETFTDPSLVDRIGYAFLDFYQSIYVAGEPESLKEVIYNDQMYNSIAEKVDDYIAHMSRSRQHTLVGEATYDLDYDDPQLPQMAYSLVMDVVENIIEDLAYLLAREDEFEPVHFDHIEVRELDPIQIRIIMHKKPVHVDLTDPAYVHLGDLVDVGVPAKALTYTCKRHGVGVGIPLERIIITRRANPYLHPA